MQHTAKAAHCTYNVCSNEVGCTATACMVQVRYESRRRLAETRPRVRGQFVKAGTAAAQSIAAQVCSIQLPQRYMAYTALPTTRLLHCSILLP